MTVTGRTAVCLYYIALYTRSLTDSSASYCISKETPCINYENFLRPQCVPHSEVSLNLYRNHDNSSFIYNLTSDCTIISNTIIINNMLLHVSTSKMLIVQRNMLHNQHFVEVFQFIF
jgi:hypothetical protein